MSVFGIPIASEWKTVRICKKLLIFSQLKQTRKLGIANAPVGPNNGIEWNFKETRRVWRVI